MTFAGLTTGELWTLFGAFGGAMVVLYILKLRRRRVEVPFSPLWARVLEEKQSSSLFRRLKRPLSLLVQLLIVALIVVALGDPKLAGMAGCSYEAPTPPPTRHTLLMIDASASMATLEGGRTRLDRAREAAHKLVDEVKGNPRHELMVVQLDARTRPLTLWTSDARALHAAIDEVAPTGALDSPTDVAAALSLAGSALQDREAGELVLVTDGAFPPIDKAAAEALHLKVIPVGEPADNIGIAAFNVRPHLDDSLTYAVFVAVYNASDKPLEATLFLYANEDGRAARDFVDPARLLASYALELPANGRVQRVIDDVKFPGSRLAARVAIAADDPTRDAFPRDDVALALVPERKKLKVALVTEGNLFLNATLFVRENVTLTTLAPADYKGPEGYDVVIIDGVHVPMTAPGNYFVIAPAPGGPFEVEGLVKEPQLARLDKKHPLARSVKLADLNILEAEKVKTERGDVVVAAAGGGVPLLFTRDDAEHGARYVVLTFDVRKSLLPMSYAFPLLVVNVLGYFHPDAAGLLVPNRAGAELSLPLALEGGEITVTGPPGAPAVSARRLGGRVHLAADRVGIYELATAEDDKRQVVAVNLMDPEESRVSPQDQGAPAWVAPPPVILETDPWLSNVWRLLLLVVLGLVVLEWFTWHRRWTL